MSPRTSSFNCSTTSYDELRSRAAGYLRQQSAAHTLQPTALVHEAYLRVAKHDDLSWKDRAHFIALSATAMRQILVDHARGKKRQKRGGDADRVPLIDGLLLEQGSPVDLLALHEALEDLAHYEPRLARVVELRFFGGASVEESAEVLGVGSATVKRDWTVARLWLLRALKDADDE